MTVLLSPIAAVYFRFDQMSDGTGFEFQAHLRPFGERSGGLVYRGAPIDFPDFMERLSPFGPLPSGASDPSLFFYSHLAAYNDNLYGSYLEDCPPIVINFRNSYIGSFAMEMFDALEGLPEADLIAVEAWRDREHRRGEFTETGVLSRFLKQWRLASRSRRPSG